MEKEGRKDERGRGRFEFLDKLPPLFPLYASLPTWNNGRVAWKDVSNFAESKVMRLERERNRKRWRDRGWREEGRGRRIYGEEHFAVWVRGEIDFVYPSLPILSPAVFYSVIVGGEAKSGRWREEERIIRKAWGSEWVRGCKGSADLWSRLHHTKRLYYVSTLIFLVSPPVRGLSSWAVSYKFVNKKSCIKRN